MIFVGVVTLLINLFFDANRKLDYLSMDSQNLNHHILPPTLNPDQPSMIFYGSCDVGNVFPFMNFKIKNLQRFDLSIPGSNLLSDLAYLKMSSGRHPKFTILGLDYTDFFLSPFVSTVVLNNLPLISQDVPDSLELKLKNFMDLRFRIYLKFLKYTQTNNLFAEPLQKTLVSLRKQFFNDELITHIFPNQNSLAGKIKNGINLWPYSAALLESFKNIAKDNGSTLVVYLLPMHVIDSRELRFANNLYNKIRMILRNEKIPFFDYTRFSQERGFYEKPNHLSLDSRKIIASLLVSDLTSLIPDESACTQNIDHLCRNTPLELRRDCLIEQFTNLSLACQKEMELPTLEDPCKIDIQKYCEDIDKYLQNDCLLTRQKNLTSRCLSSLSPTPLKKRPPCYLDELTFCNGLSYKANILCLASHYKELTPNCQDLQDKTPCLADWAKYCNESTSGDVPAAKTCLYSHSNELTPSCQSHLDHLMEQFAMWKKKYSSPESP